MKFQNPQKLELKVERSKVDEAESGDKIGLLNSKISNLVTPKSSKTEKKEINVPRKSLENFAKVETPVEKPNPPVLQNSMVQGHEEPESSEQKRETTQVPEQKGPSKIEEENPGFFSSFLSNRPIFDTRCFEVLFFDEYSGRMFI
ncbi:hypothetical protein B9Z55_004040 [Caenorhabditis nigoni]|uniref:Uncharacterized protein n=1 Tax=Caenorhabditis nigoni TaxID=1611254 RepID=A0A2G5UVI7_9PELO|nr:hypothetical protein B9Z55_004040 [Caenorhabditis nigoni]